MSTYQEWLKQRDRRLAHESIRVPADELHPVLFPHQRHLVSWALETGRAAIFADTGLGKTPMQVEWAKHVTDQRGRVLIIAPLAVSQQTVLEAERLLGVDVEYDRTGQSKAPIVICNYEMAPQFDPAQFAGVVLDESSILKSYDGKTRTMLIDMFQRTPFRLCCTATPAPNDHMELGNHSEFLGVKSQQEMLSEFFVHDMSQTQLWRLKGHARHLFWKWVGDWASMIKKPSDLGYSDEGFDLPVLVEEHLDIETESLNPIDADRLRAEEEIADVVIYAARLADVLGIDMHAAIAAKMTKNAEKYPVYQERLF